jgi:uncharacterized protein YceH (UPF0502 family)
MDTHEDTREDTLLLSPIEARIVGCLFEKQATTPDQYPLTLNAAVLACNQKTAREPLMQLEPGEVGHALRQLESRGWVKSQHASRADRYEHRLEARLGLPRDQAAVLVLLMLRGPQTPAELLARSERLARLSGLDDVQHVLDRLAQRTPGLAVRLPRQAGQREDRWAHRLSGEPAVPAAAPRDVPARSGSTPAREVDTAAAAQAVAELDARLDARLAQLEQRVAELEARLLTVSHPLAGV